MVYPQWLAEKTENVCLWKGDSQEQISSAMNTIILILHFPFFNYSRSILGFIFDITTLYDCQFLH